MLTINKAIRVGNRGVWFLLRHEGLRHIAVIECAESLTSAEHMAAVAELQAEFGKTVLW